MAVGAGVKTLFTLGVPRRVLLGPVILALPLAGCSGVLDPRGPVGVSERLILFDSFSIMLVIVIPVILATFAFAWWFRASNKRATYRPNWAFSGTLELIVWAIPAIVVTFLGGIAWFGSHELDPYKPIPSASKPVEVEVVSLDWKWLFIYPDEGIATVNQLVVPAGTPVSFHLTSATVMNSFFVPQLGSQIYTMAGMATHLNLLADKPGEYPGFSTNFSGDGFSEMRFVASVVPAGDFDGWVAKVKGAGNALDDPSYTELTKASRAVPPTTYRSVDPKLFERIVDQTALNPDKARAGNAGCP